MELETVKVASPVSEENPLGYIVINKSDLTDEHQVFDEKKAPALKGPSIEEIRAALTEKGIEFAADAKKADLQKLLDAANQG